MAKIDRNTSIWLAVGVGAAIAAPLVMPLLSSVARPLGRAAGRVGGIVAEKARETAEEFGEVFEDFVAEAQAAIEERRLEKVATATTAAIATTTPEDKPSGDANTNA